MHRVVTIPLLLLGVAVLGCSRQPGPPVPVRSVVLHDVQGLWGGHALWAREDGAAVLQVVGEAPQGRSGLWEKRYHLKLTRDQLAEVERLVGAHHFLVLRIKERHGVPDESHPVIAIVTKDGATAKAMTWAGDKHPDFDPLYDYLLGVCRGADMGQPVHEGAYDWEWRPEGFDRPW
jgi:hypothetical protein